jgi:hypothetical protein
MYGGYIWKGKFWCNGGLSIGTLIQRLLYDYYHIWFAGDFSDVEISSNIDEVHRAIKKIL